jgi:predicted ATPase/DNA-binding SARP family transcriptional activator
MTGEAHMRLELRVLGSFELRRDGESIRHWPRAGARQLLKRLAVSERQAIRAEALAESFWPDDDSERVMQRLHNLLYLLRKTLQPDDAFEPCLRTDGGTVRLITGETLWIDLVEFEHQLDAAALGDEEEGRLEQALTLYRGCLLGDEADDDWLAPRRAQIEGRFVAASHRLSTLQIQQGRLRAAIQTLNKLLAEVLTHELAHRELITLYGRLGRAEDVQRQFKECAAVLQRELDAQPSAETCSAYQAAQAQSEAARPAQETGAQRSSPRHAQANTPERWTSPHPVVQLLGRDEAVRSAVQQLRAGVRLLSLVGTGGIGKTQLAIRIAHEAQQAYPQGACFVPLAEARPGELYPAIARAMGLKLSRHEEPKITVWRALEHCRLLVVADNFEHMLDEAAELLLLLPHAPGVALLVTSRMRLNLAVETCMAVSPLAVESTGADPPEAMRLFIDCARRVRPQLLLDDADTADVAAITRCLGGLPLAIELAAARLPLFSVSELRRAVEASLRVLAGGGAGRPPRQRSLRESFLWSYTLLQPQEQQLLLMLGLCDASFDHHDARGLGGADAADAGLKLQTLVELGFVMRARAGELDASRESRFELAPALREFVREELQGHADRAVLRCRFIEHFIEQADRLDEAMDAGDAKPVRQALSDFAVQSPNFFAALKAAAQGAGQPVEVYRLVAGLARLWGYGGVWHEPKRWIEQASKQADVLEPRHRARLMYNVSTYWERHGLAGPALVAVNQAVGFAQEADQPGVLARALVFTSLLAARDTQVPLETLWGLLSRARPLAAQVRDARLMSLIPSSQAMIHFARGNVRRARAMLAVCDRRLERAGDDFARAKINFNLAKVLAYSGKPDAALASLEQVFARLRGTAPSAVADAYVWAGWFHCCHMDVPRARDMARLARETMVGVGSNYLQFAVGLLEGRIALLTGAWPQALALLSSAVLQESTDAEPWAALEAQFWCVQAAIAMHADDIGAKALRSAVNARLRWPREHPRMLEAAAAWFAHHQRDDAAARAWLQADAIRNNMGLVRFPADRAMNEDTCAKLAQSLGPGWQLERRTKALAIEDDDLLAWLADALSESDRAAPLGGAKVPEARSAVVAASAWPYSTTTAARN